MKKPSKQLLELIHRGCVLPASPLALDKNRHFDEKSQQNLMNYYLDAGAGGVAVGMHFTQFEIRNPGINLFKTVLATCAEAIDQNAKKSNRVVAKIAGINGKTDEALRQAETAAALGYDFAIISMSAFKDALEEDMIYHMEQIAQVMPIFGFYLLTGVGGIHLSYNFWRRVVEMDNIHAIKIAPFNRYFTIDVCRALAESGQQDRIALYTGNDDSIVYDLLTPYQFRVGNETRSVRIRGGLLGQWACWTQRAVQLLEEIHDIVDNNKNITPEFLMRSSQITDANAALFDPSHGYAGSIPGVNEILRRQGLMQTHKTLKPDEVLSPGQMEEIDRVCAAYPHLQDNEFASNNFGIWTAKD